MAVEVGIGYVSVVPEVQGFAAELQRQVTGPSEQAGQEGGEAAGEGFTGKMGGFLKGSLVTVGLAAAALLVKGFNDALDRQALDGHIQASLGSTPQEAARYGKAAGQLYAHGVTDSMEDAAESITGVMRAGILPPDATNAQIESIAGKVTDLSNTFDLDLGQSANAVGQILKNGLAKNGTEALDILTVGMQKMGPRADDMADTFNEYSTKFRDLGLSAADAMGLMSQGMLAGARDTDTVADALKEFQIRATDGSTTSAAAYKAIGLNAQEMTRKIAKGGPDAKAGLQQVLDGIKAIPDPAKRSQAAVGLFGTKAEDLGKALYALDPSTAVKGLGDTADAANKMGDALHDNAEARITQFKRTAEVALTNFIGDKVLPPLLEFATTTARVVGPALRDGEKVVAGFFTSFSSGSGGTAVLGLGRDLLGLGTTVRDILSPSLGSLVLQFRTQMLPALQGVWAVVSGQLIPAVMSFYSAVYSAVMPVLTSLTLILVGTVIPAVMKVYSAFVSSLQPIFAAVSEFVTSRVVPAVRDLGDRLNVLVQKSQPVISVVASITAFLGVLAAKILGVVVPLLLRLAGPVFSLVFGAIGTGISWLSKIIGWLVAFGTAVGNAVKSVADFYTKSVAKFKEFGTWMSGFPGMVKGYLGDFGQLLVGEGEDLVRGLWNGISGMTGWLKSKLTGWAKSAIPGPIRGALGIGSPSRLMASDVGRWIPPGVVVGIDDEQDALDARLQSLVTVPKVTIPPVSVGAPARSSATDGAGPELAELLRALAADRGRDIVLTVGAQEIARATAAGQRELARR